MNGDGAGRRDRNIVGSVLFCGKWYESERGGGEGQWDHEAVKGKRGEEHAER
jgi:hypothetical protein